MNLDPELQIASFFYFILIYCSSRVFLRKKIMNSNLSLLSRVSLLLVVALLFLYGDFPLSRYSSCSVFEFNYEMSFCDLHASACLDALFLLQFCFVLQMEQFFGSGKERRKLWHA